MRFVATCSKYCVATPSIWIEPSLWVHFFLLCKKIGLSISLHPRATAYLSWTLSFLINFLSFVIFQVFLVSWEFDLSKVCEIWVKYKLYAFHPCDVCFLISWHYIFLMFFFFLVAWSSSFMPFHPCDVYLLILQQYIIFMFSFLLVSWSSQSSSSLHCL